MLAFLKRLWADEFAQDTEDSPYTEFCAEGAIYWFANDWHGGQGSNLYRALSTSAYHPSPMEHEVSRETLDGYMYDDLEEEFA